MNKYINKFYKKKQNHLITTLMLGSKTFLTYTDTVSILSY